MHTVSKSHCGCGDAGILLCCAASDASCSISSLAMSNIVMQNYSRGEKGVLREIYIALVTAMCWLQGAVHKVHQDNNLFR